MQSYALTVDKFIDHAAKWSGAREVVTADAGRIGYAALRDRANRLSGALASLGLEPSDRIATLAWNTAPHLEALYAISGMGAVCHTLNPRLTPAQLVAVMREAQDRAILASADLAPLVSQLVADAPELRHVIWLDGPADPETRLTERGSWDAEALLAERGHPVTWGGFDEERPAGLCYTSGTTGAPRGVLYTHRSNYLHTLRSLQADAFALTREDALLVAVPLFHANGWGFPFAAPAVGAKLVLPGRRTDGAALVRLMTDERVTVAAGVQTVWLGVLDHLDATGADLPDLQRVIIGGSSCPEALIRRMEDRLGAAVQTSWGMTELSPLGTVAPPRARAAADGSSGRPVMGLDLKLTDSAGATLPEQRGVVGRLKVKGPSVVDRYYGAADDALDGDGWFDTGDLATIGPDGALTLCGRTKDLIKSGGEWINPAEIEDIVGRLPQVGLVAVIARADAKWGERPVLVVEPRDGAQVEPPSLIAALRGRVADWWLPDEVALLAAMPLAATGKIDKTRLRADYAAGEIVGHAVRR